jgi:hypothetical protein
MILFRHLFVVLIASISLINNVNAEERKQNFYRNFWNPTYNGQRLNYCTLDSKACGLAVANKYCKLMGYEKANEAIIDYNVGLTNYILTRAQCKGWNCNSFTLITCTGNFSQYPPKVSSYRSQRFVFPRVDHYRIDWCYENSRGCGQRAAYSFCRRMGYMNAQYFKKQEHVMATKALGNGKLCFGDDCSGFSSITCYR